MANFICRNWHRSDRAGANDLYNWRVLIFGPCNASHRKCKKDTYWTRSIDFILNGSGSPRGLQERSRFLYQVVENSRLHLLLRRFLHYHDRVVDVHSGGFPVADVGHLLVIPVLPRHHHDLRTVSTSHRRSLEKRCCEERSQNYWERWRRQEGQSKVWSVKYMYKLSINFLNIIIRDI